jgi:hypothetical protein
VAFHRFFVGGSADGGPFPPGGEDFSQGFQESTDETS